MGASSGEAGRASPLEQFDRAAFTHAASGFRYRVGAYWLEFEETGDPRLQGKTTLA